MHFGITDNFWYKLEAHYMEITEEMTDLGILGDHRIGSSQQYVPGTKGQTELEIDQVFPVEIRKYLCLTRHDKAISEYHVQLQFSLLQKGNSSHNKSTEELPGSWEW